MENATYSHLQNDFDAVGVPQLETVLKERIAEYLAQPQTSPTGRKGRGSYAKLAKETGISQGYIHRFHQRNQAICITNLNKLANYFQVRYMVMNYES